MPKMNLSAQESDLWYLMQVPISKRKRQASLKSNAETK